jgi:hypothetical protein
MVITLSHSGQYVLAICIFFWVHASREIQTDSPLFLVLIVVPILFIVEGKVHLEGIEADDL